MIFTPEMAKLILQGKKTQARRPCAEQAVCRYEIGRSYAIQPGHGKRAVGRITITDSRDGRLGEVTLKDARREGFITTEEFFEHWRSLYGSVDAEQRVWVLSFVLGDRTDTPRLLAARPGAPHGDYVSNPHLAMPGEPEGLGVSDLARYAKAAGARDAQRRGDPLRVKRDKVAEALAELKAALPGSSGELRDTVRRLERELAVLDRKLAA